MRIRGGGVLTVLGRYHFNVCEVLACFTWCIYYVGVSVEVLFIFA